MVEMVEQVGEIGIDVRKLDELDDEEVDDI